MAFQDSGLEKIKEALKEGPQLLSVLGELLTPDERPESGLNSALKKAGIPVKRIGYGPKIYAYLNENAGDISNLIKEGNSVSTSSPYRKAVLFAFCKRIDDNEKMSLSIEPKVEYVISKNDDPLSTKMIIVEKEFRRPDFDIYNMTAEQRKELEDSIRKWIEKNKIDEKKLLWEPTKSTDDKNSELGKLIQQFLAAQPETLRSKVNIPGFIIQQLIKSLN